MRWFETLLRFGFCAVLVLELPALGSPQEVDDAGGAVTVLDGVYTGIQAARGKATYEANCARCHQVDLSGNPEAPTLKGDRFVERWREASLVTLFDYMQNRMPPPSASTRSLAGQEYADIIAYVLSYSAFPMGPEELTVSRLGDILLVGKDGPQPLPNMALVRTVGCLARDADGEWGLTQAAELTRVARAYEATSEEMDAAARDALGDSEFSLRNVEIAQSRFTQPEQLKEGSKVQVKGPFIARQPRDRIMVVSVEVVAPQCGP